MDERNSLSDEEREIYEWQIWSPQVGERGQEKLKAATVLVSRVGGLGSVVAYELAAAGVGRLILAHAGNVKPSDLNRQLLMTHAGIGRSRVESAQRRLWDLNPRLQIEAVPENMSPDNADRWVSQADVVVDCAPMFQERFAMNDAAHRHGVPLVECAMYNFDFQLYTVLPGETACVRCIHPGIPPTWKRQFPVVGAVSGTVGCLGAMEAIKLLLGVERTLSDRMLLGDLATMTFQQIRLQRRPDCPVCGEAADCGTRDE